MTLDKSKEIGAFFQKFNIRTYKKGETLIRSDDEPLGVYYLTKGFVRRYTISPAGFELTLQVFKPYSIFPIHWVLSGEPNMYDFDALSDIEVRRAPREQLIDFIKSNTDTLYELTCYFVGNYAETLNRIEGLVFNDSYRKVISALLYLSKYFGKEKGKRVVIQYRFTQQDIAKLIGVARETASVEMAILERKGLYKYSDHTIVLEDINKLRTELLQAGLKSTR